MSAFWRSNREALVVLLVLLAVVALVGSSTLTGTPIPTGTRGPAVQEGGTPGRSTEGTLTPYG